MGILGRGATKEGLARLKDLKREFFSCNSFIVVGLYPGLDQSKPAAQAAKLYLQRGKTVWAYCPDLKSDQDLGAVEAKFGLESGKAVRDLDVIPDPSTTGVSMVVRFDREPEMKATKPREDGVETFDKAVGLGFTHFWFQTGTEPRSDEEWEKFREIEKRIPGDHEQKVIVSDKSWNGGLTGGTPPCVLVSMRSNEDKNL